MMRMRKIASIVTLCCMVLIVWSAAGFAANFGQQGVFSFSNTGDATGQAGAYLAFGGAVADKGELLEVKNLNVTSDKAGSVVTILTQNGDSTTTDAAATAAQKILPVTATTSFQATTPGVGSWIAIVDWRNQRFEINRISSLTAGVSLNLVRNIGAAYASGSYVYELDSVGTLPVGAATKDWYNTTIYGEVGEVLGLALDGTSACSINYAAGKVK